MAKVVVHILAAIGIGYWLYRTAVEGIEKYYTDELGNTMVLGNQEV